MDQDAFRNLLSAPRPAASGSSSRGVLGAPPPKRGWGLKTKEGYEKKKEVNPTKPEFAPRKYHKKEHQQESNSESQYKDRAEQRRKGVENSEYSDVTKLLKDFEERKSKVKNSEELEELEKQRAYLGGDVEHSVLVKGLDYALLASRKAELAREKGEQIDDELDNLGQGLGKKSIELKVDNKEEKLGRGFKSIAQKKIEESEKGEKKKKKKKKKVKSDIPANTVEEPKTEMKDDVKLSEPIPTQVENLPATIVPALKKEASPLPSDDEDIFGDVGEYDLKAGVGDSDSSDDGKMDIDIKNHDEDISSRGRSRTRSPIRRKSGYGPRSPGYRHDRSRSRSYDRSRSRSRSRTRTYRDRSPIDRRRRSPSYDDRRRSPNPYSRRRSPSPYRRRYRDRSISYSRSRSRSRSPYYARRRSPSRDRYRSASRSRSPRRRGYARSKSPSPIPKGRYSTSRSPEPVQKRERSISYTPEPYLVEPPRSPSLSNSEGEEDGGGGIKYGEKLKPLQGSIITSVKSFLEEDIKASKEEEKKMKKAKWRAAQGLSIQDGANDLLNQDKKEREDKHKQNREYQLLMNRMNKKENNKD
ncbi:uncharacterized protein I206_107261 [Kwoniella pini CBS 10737]|uniref:RED-like N-terminal domain-containing protein n=1 Tax=Kwoniella pini CBS 10737 TaxID=1296096 RepID=A0A1B9HYR1_9TREE|nr:uncharacterized protein I206_05194 [Kwoniella pini CBS 10737]OCF48417.1 hypothetical protein I206_05194 [Kwoniella pini CBS 10737]